MSHAESEKTFESPETEREQRKRIVRHLWDFHGQYKPDRFGRGRLSLKEIEIAHRILHEDDYMCPPHSHPSDTGSIYGEMKINLPEHYLSDTTLTAQGFDEEVQGWKESREEVEGA